MFIPRFSTVALFVSLSTTALADFSGSWKGTGSAWDTDGWKSECTVLAMDIQQTAKSITFGKSETTCGAFSQVSTSSYTLNIKNGELFIFGQKVGTINADKIVLDGVRPGESIRKHVEFEISGTALKYSQWILDQNTGHRTDIVGDVSK